MKKKQEGKRYSVSFDRRFASRIDTIAHFKGLTTSQLIRMIVMDSVYGSGEPGSEKIKKK
jgi:predicted DNA-binding ribbon-helix-helix protein